MTARTEDRMAKTGVAFFLLLIFALIGLCMYGAIRDEHRRNANYQTRYVQRKA